MRIQNIHAHFDDFEFTAGGTFERLRRHHAGTFAAEVVVCTDGAAGHHLLTREETAQIRLEEQRASARIGQYGVKQLHYPDGSPCLEGYLEAGPRLQAALWKVIRQFKPDYIVCPPVPADPISGVHLDHLTVAQAMRSVAFLINVPHVYTPEFPEEKGIPEFIKTPVILNPYDPYMRGGNTFDLAIRIDEAFDLIAETSWCHQSQIIEWLPWVSGRTSLVPKDFADWKRLLRDRFQRQNQDLGIQSDHLHEFFVLTGWGSCPSLDQLLEDFPGIDRNISDLPVLKAKIDRLNRSID